MSYFYKDRPSQIDALLTDDDFNLNPGEKRPTDECRLNAEEFEELASELQLWFNTHNNACGEGPMAPPALPIKTCDYSCVKFMFCDPPDGVVDCPHHVSAEEYRAAQEPKEPEQELELHVKMQPKSSREITDKIYDASAERLARESAWMGHPNPDCPLCHGLGFTPSINGTRHFECACRFICHDELSDSTIESYEDFIKWRRQHLTPLSKEAQEARRPLPPETLVGALQDKVHKDVGNSRPAKTVRIKAAELVSDADELETDLHDPYCDLLNGGYECSCAITDVSITATIDDEFFASTQKRWKVYCEGFDPNIAYNDGEDSYPQSTIAYHRRLANHNFEIVTGRMPNASNCYVRELSPDEPEIETFEEIE